MKIPSSDPTFGSTYEVRGIELAQFLNPIGIEKKRDDGFNRELDMFVQVIGRGGRSAVFSYGELFYGDHANGILLAGSFRFLYPHKHPDMATASWKTEEWFSGNVAEKAQKAGCLTCHNGTNPPALLFPKGWCVVATHDAWPGRYVEDVVEIRVSQIPAAQIVPIASQPNKTMWVEKPSVVLPDGTKTEISPEVLKGLPHFSLPGCAFGLGKGFHGVHVHQGFDLAMVLGPLLEKVDANQLCIAITSPDGYRGMFSGAEVLHLKGPGNVLLVDAEDGAATTPGNGKYKVFVNNDFFIDRSLRSIAEIRCFIPENAGGQK